MGTFTAIDFETANGARASACSIAAVVMDESGQVLATRSDLLRPLSGHDWFAARNIDIHGITPAMVADSPTWDELVDDYLDLIGAGPVVAHNMAFDASVWDAMAAEIGTPTLDAPRLCTYRTAATLLGWPRGTMKLDMVHRHYFPGRTFTHHRADADALACAQILLAQMAEAGFDLAWMVENRATARRPRGPRW
ncbi:DNA polymerase III subunit epsilon [Cutibacterium avidum]|uniref:exonuclease domain-containing protein n=1 Tax=Cutibacterium avidum TaxID=33010 RepID=UPI00192B21EC|nr:exonuclease domain-containing protein [Cutibacterium avidum]QQY15613.1 DNA polymerase III subunit epsilon [Cutibacterium avidum]